MARKDYIEKITQNLEHLTKDELKDVVTLTNAQFGVRLKVAEKEYWVKEIADLKSQLQQQALPVVPECVAVQIERVKNSNGNFATLGLFDWNHEAKPDYTKWIHENVFDFMRACTIGYTVEKPQLFYLREKNTGYYLRKTGNDVYGITPHYSNDYDEKYMRYKFTQSEIDSMETGSYELVPVEDGE